MAQLAAHRVVIPRAPARVRLDTPFFLHAGIAQQVEHPAFNREVRRSSRRARTI